MNHKSTFNKLKSNLKGMHFRFKQKYNWINFYINRKYIIPVYYIKKIGSSTVAFSCIVSFFLFFFYKINILTISNGIKLNNITNLNIGITGLLSTQFSLSLILISLVSLISNLDKQYIYGEKTIELVFKGKGVLTIKMLFFLLLVLPILNILVLINNYGDTYFLLNFLVTLCIIIYIAYRFILVYTNPEFYMNQLLLKYYTENIKTIKKSVPLNTFDSKYLKNIKTITELQIIKNNPIYIENINLLLHISDISLFNYPKMVQEYYTELIHRKCDCFSIISYLSIKLLEHGHRNEAANIYLDIYSKLNYYRIVNTSDHDMDFQIETLIKEAKYIETEVEMIKYHRIIFSLIYNYIYQTYLYSITNFSYCRLGKIKNGNLIHRFTTISSLETYYLSVYENKYLSDIEKNRIYLELYDNLRMTELNETFPKLNINNFFNHDSFNRTKEVIPLIIKSEPIVLLILKVIENDDFKLAQIFLKMNLSNKTMIFIRTLILLSLINILSSDNKRTYFLDLNLNIEKVIKGINAYNILDFTIDSTDLDLFYKLISSNYSSDSKRQSNSLSQFHPRLTFNQKTIDTFFAHKGYIVDNLKISESVKKTINSLYNNKRSYN